MLHIGVRQRNGQDLHLRIMLLHVSLYLQAVASLEHIFFQDNQKLMALCQTVRQSIVHGLDEASIRQGTGKTGSL